MERNKEQNKIQSIQQNNDTKTQVELITEKLEAGMTEIMSDGGKYEDYLRTISKFHRYSLNNTMLIRHECRPFCRCPPLRTGKDGIQSFPCSRSREG